jgi:hypothetical protein
MSVDFRRKAPGLMAEIGTPSQSTRHLLGYMQPKESPAMAARSSRKSSQAKVSEHRRRLRTQGLRPIQIWVPDVRAPRFKAEAHRQSLAVATSLQASEDQYFIDEVSALRLDEDLE